MPQTNLVLFRDSAGKVPLIQWLDELPSKVLAKCLVKLQRLQEMGHDLRRPEADYLRDDIYELRVGRRGQNYRMLYFFHGRDIVVVSHGLTKEDVVPVKEIDLAVERRALFRAKPANHTAALVIGGQEDGEENRTQEDN